MHSTCETVEQNQRKLAAEIVEGRHLTKRNTQQQNSHQTQCWNSDEQTALLRIRQTARKDKSTRFTSLIHHITTDRLRDCFFKIKKQAAPGIDKVTWSMYEQNLEFNLQDLHKRTQSGGYRAQPSRRTFIPKPNGEKRPLGIATLEDKVLQRAMVEVLNAIYEEDFLGFSYGFRPKRSAHQALDALAVGIRARKISWIIDADIRRFFDSMNHDWLMKFLEHRIADKRVLRLIKKWLKAGVMESGKFVDSENGVPQGAPISPLLSNIYLHYVLDLWVNQWRDKRAHGDVIVVRFADDFIIGLQDGCDAALLRKQIEARFSKFSLTIHPEKSKVLRFGRFAKRDVRRYDGRRKPETFTFLGFTHCCATNRNGKFKVIRKTQRSRMRDKLKVIKTEMRRRMHQPVVMQGKWLRAVVQGYMNYHAIPDNIATIAAFKTQISHLWYKSLKRRSQRNRLDWFKMTKLVRLWLPREQILHPWPERRFEVMTQGRSPVQ